MEHRLGIGKGTQAPCLQPDGVRGGGRLRLMPITIVIGEPILFSAADLELSGKNLYVELSGRVMKAISALSLK